jgi:hypothetical protein
LVTAVYFTLFVFPLAKSPKRSPKLSDDGLFIGAYWDIPKSNPFKGFSLVYWGTPELKEAGAPVDIIPPGGASFLEPGGGANFFRPPLPPRSGADGFSVFLGMPGMLILIFSPSFREKSLPLSFIEVTGCYVPFTILSYFLKSSSPAIKSNESFLSGKPMPTIAFYPFSFWSTSAKKRLESKHL